MSDWRSSTVRESVLKSFVTKGFLPPKEVAHWRVPGREESPQPWPGEVVSFLTFHERGLGYPTHWFLRGLLNEWVWSYSILIQRGCCTSPVSSPSVRLSSGWSRTWISSDGCSLGEP